VASGVTAIPLNPEVPITEGDVFLEGGYWVGSCWVGTNEDLVSFKETVSFVIRKEEESEEGVILMEEC
jgi:hypothetical protein